MDCRISHDNLDTSIETFLSTSFENFDDDNPDLMDTMGERIRARRTELGWSQKRLAAEVKRSGGQLASNSVSNIEMGKRRAGYSFHKIAEALGVTTAWLESGAQPKLAKDAEGSRPGVSSTVLIQTIVDVLTIIRDDPSFNRKLTDDEIRGLAIAIQTKASRAELKLESSEDLTAYIDMARQARVFQ